MFTFGVKLSLGQVQKSPCQVFQAQKSRPWNYSMLSNSNKRNFAILQPFLFWIIKASLDDCTEGRFCSHLIGHKRRHGEGRCSDWCSGFRPLFRPSSKGFIGRPPPHFCRRVLLLRRRGRRKGSDSF